MFLGIEDGYIVPNVSVLGISVGITGLVSLWVPSDCAHEISGTFSFVLTGLVLFGSSIYVLN